MCLGVPGRVIQLSVRDTLPTAIVAFGGVTRPVCVAFVPEVRTDQYVLVHAGIALEIIDEAHANELLEHLRSIGDEELAACEERLP